MDNSMFGYVCMISVEGIELFRAVFHITSQQWCTEGRGVQTPPRNSEDIGGVLHRMNKNRRFNFLL